MKIKTISFDLGYTLVCYGHLLNWSNNYKKLIEKGFYSIYRTDKKKVIERKYQFKNLKRCGILLKGKPSPNRSVYASPPYGGSGYEKTQSGLCPFVRFFSATFGAGVVASQRPITCPKRHIQPERYVPVF